MTLRAATDLLIAEREAVEKHVRFARSVRIGTQILTGRNGQRARKPISLHLVVIEPAALYATVVARTTPYGLLGRCSLVFQRDCWHSFWAGWRHSMPRIKVRVLLLLLLA